MRRLKHYILISIAAITFAACSCSDDSDKKTVKQFPEVEEVAKEHALRFSNSNLNGMETQQKLFEVRAHEQDLRAAGMNEEADYYIEMFTKHLKNTNPSLAKEIEKK